MKLRSLCSVLGLVALTACSPAVRPSGSDPSGSTEPAVAPASRTLSIVLRVEPLGAADSSSSLNRISLALFSAPLVSSDHNEQRHAILAEAIPQLDTDSWRVFPDGRMETTYRLRAGLTWHDGVPLTADDFVFGRQVAEARATWGQSTRSEESQLIDSVVAVDPRTLLIRWRQPYAEAAIPALLPFAQHIIGPALEQGQADAFNSHPYWFGDYVGAGPYRLNKWESGAFIEGQAFDGFALGRPKIGRVVLTWSQDPNVTLSRLLAGDADIALDDALQFQEATTLRREWSASGAGSLILSPTRLRFIQIQFRPEYVSPRALLDLRVRKALLHAFDRPTLANVMLDGQGMVAETGVPPTLSYYPDVDRAIMKYPFDVRQSDALMAEAGFPKATDGFYTSPTEGRLSLQVRGIAEGQEGRETTIIADGFRRAGAESTLDLVPSAQRIQSNELKATFPSLTVNNGTIYRDLALSKNLTSTIASPANRWGGGNKPGYSNPEYDRLYSAWKGAVDRQERNQVVVQLLTLMNDDLPILPLYFNFDVVAHVATLVGPTTEAPDSDYYSNVYEWHWR